MIQSCELHVTIVLQNSLYLNRAIMQLLKTRNMDKPRPNHIHDHTPNEYTYIFIFLLCGCFVGSLMISAFCYDKLETNQ